MNEFEERYTGKGCQQRFADEIMGKKVTFTDVYKREYYFDHITQKWCLTRWDRLNGDEQTGWIVGSTQMYEGRYCSGGNRSSLSFDGYEEGEYEQAYLEVTNCVKAVLVTVWPSRKPYKVPYDNVALVEEKA